jgi:hypothetical protein
MVRLIKHFPIEAISLSNANYPTYGRIWDYRDTYNFAWKPESNILAIIFHNPAIVSSSDSEGELALFDLDSQQLTYLMPIAESFRPLVFSDDGKFLAIDVYNELTILDAETWKIIFEGELPRGGIYDLFWISPTLLHISQCSVERATSSDEFHYSAWNAATNSVVQLQPSETPLAPYYIPESGRGRQFEYFADAYGSWFARNPRVGLNAWQEGDKVLIYDYRRSELVTSIELSGVLHILVWHTNDELILGYNNSSIEFVNFQNNERRTYQTGIGVIDRISMHSFGSIAALQRDDDLWIFDLG